jgi:hypothetical protein
VRQQQRRLAAFSGLHAADGGVSAAVTPEQLGPDEEGVTDSAFDEEQSSSMAAFEEEQISREMEEVLQAIDAQQQQQAATTARRVSAVEAQQGQQREGGYDGGQSEDHSDAQTSQAPYTDVDEGWDGVDAGEGLLST